MTLTNYNFEEDDQDSMSWFGDNPLTDIAAGLGSGILGGVEGVLSLATFGQIEFEDNFGLFDAPEGIIGNLISGFSQIAVGYATGGAALGGISKLAKFHKMAKVSKVASNIKNAQKMKTVGGRLAAEVGRVGVADFVAFKGDEGRLADILKDVPGLEFTKFLASEEDDSDIEGRLKNMVEGSFLGLGVDSVMEVFRGVRKANKAIQTKASEQKVVETLDDVEDTATVARSETYDDVTTARRYEETDTEEMAVRTWFGELSDDFDPSEGTVILSRNVVGGDGVALRGSNRIDAKIVQGADDAYSSIGAFQLSKTARILDLTGDSGRILTKKAREILGSKGSAGSVPMMNKMQLLEMAVKKSGEYDVIRHGHNYSVVNPDVIRSQVTRLPGDPIRQLQKAGRDKIWSQLPKSVTNNMPVMSMLRSMDLTHENIVAIADDLDKLVASGAKPEDLMGAKLPGGLNISKLNGKNVQMLHILRQQMLKGGDETALTQKVKGKKQKRRGKGKHKRKRDRVELGTEHAIGKDAEELGGEALQEMSTMLGRPLAEVSEQIRQDIRNVEGAARRWQSGKGIIEAYSKTLYDMKMLARKLENGYTPNGAEANMLKTTTTDGAETMMTKEQFSEHIARLSYDMKVFADLNGFTGSVLGQGLQRGRFGTDTWDQTAYQRLLDRKGPGRYDTLQKVYNRQLDMASGDHSVAAALDIAAKNPKMQGVLKYLYFALLSGPKTFSVNALGVTGQSFYRPLEGFLGAMVAKKVMSPKMAHGMSRAMQKNLKRFHYLGQEFKDLAVTFKRRATKDPSYNPKTRTGKGVERAVRTFTDPSSPGLTGNAAWVDTDVTGLKNRTKGDHILNAPTGLMKLADEMGKHANVFAYLRAELEQQWDDMWDLYRSDPQKHADLGWRLKKVDRHHWVEAEAMNMLSRDHIATKEALYMEASEYHPHRNYPDALERMTAIKHHVDNRLKYGLSTGDRGMPLVKDRAGLADRARSLAQENSFTKPLAEMASESSELAYAPKLIAHGGYHLQRLTTSFPIMKFTTPFVQTPINLLLAASDRMAVPFLNQDLTEVIHHFLRKGKAKIMGQEAPKFAESSGRFAKILASGDEDKIAEAVGRMSMAVGLTTTMAGAAAAGIITGAGPSDRDHQMALRESGWQPYSLKVGDTYVSYQKLDPFASMIGLVADVHDHMKYETEMDDDNSELSEVVQAIAVATFEQLQSKSYLQGLGQLMDMATDPTKEIPEFSGKMLGNLIPNLIASSDELFSDNIEEAQGLWGTFTRRIPGEMIANKKRNALGEPISRRKFESAGDFVGGMVNYTMGINVNHTGDDPLDQAIAELDFPLRRPFHHKVGLNLKNQINDTTGQSAWDRWQELTAEVKVGGRTLREHLRRTVNSKRFREIGMIANLGNEDAYDEYRRDMLHEIIFRYRDAAWRKVLQEYEEVAYAARQSRSFRVDRMMRLNDPDSLDLNYQPR
ncbi:MAG: hypothetical protein CL581_20345 [Alteromonadaceae bacterium]|nr:hypothetical protein [Alteromonadaceae bacterium]